MPARKSVRQAALVESTRTLRTRTTAPQKNKSLPKKLSPSSPPSPSSTPPSPSNEPTTPTYGPVVQYCPYSPIEATTRNATPGDVTTQNDDEQVWIAHPLEDYMSLNPNNVWRLIRAMAVADAIQKKFETLCTERWNNRAVYYINYRMVREEFEEDKILSKHIPFLPIVMHFLPTIMLPPTSEAEVITLADLLTELELATPLCHQQLSPTLLTFTFTEDERARLTNINDLMYVCLRERDCDPCPAMLDLCDDPRYIHFECEYKKPWNGEDDDIRCKTCCYARLAYNYDSKCDLLDKVKTVREYILAQQQFFFGLPL